MSLDSEIDALTHSHVYLGKRHDENARRTLWVVLLTAAMMVGEIVAGIASAISVKAPLMIACEAITAATVAIKIPAGRNQPGISE